MKINEKQYKELPENLKQLFRKVNNTGSEEIFSMFPDSKGQRGHVSDKQRTKNNCFGDTSDNGKQYIPRKDSGSAARFFFCAKTKKKDRGEGNNHPTVKPTELMRYLCRLITPKSGTILDPFMGSGSTGKAALLEGFNFMGIETQEEYYKIAEKRIKEVKGE